LGRESWEVDATIRIHGIATPQAIYSKAQATDDPMLLKGEYCIS